MTFHTLKECIGKPTNNSWRVNKSAPNVTIGVGSVAPGVDFNFHMDPDAASLVLDRASTSNTSITLIPMETIYSNDLTKDFRWSTLAKINNSVVSFLNTLEKRGQEIRPKPSYTPADVYAIATALFPAIITKTENLYGFVDNRSQMSRGHLLIDYMNTTKKQANIEVVTEVNTTLIQNVMLENLANYA